VSFIRKKFSRGVSVPDSTEEFVKKATIQRDVYTHDEQDQKRQELLGHLQEIGHDDGAEVLMDTSCFETVPMYKQNEDGTYEIDKKPTLADGKTPNPNYGKPVIVMGERLNFHNAGLRIFASPKNQWRVLEQVDVDIAKLEMQSAYLKQLASMPRSAYDIGQVNFVRAIKSDAALNLADSKKGNKLRVTIAPERRSRVEVGPIQKEKKGVF
jgi:hypothetical protein